MRGWWWIFEVVRLWRVKETGDRGSARGEGGAEQADQRGNMVVGQKKKRGQGDGKEGLGEREENGGRWTKPNLITLILYKHRRRGHLCQFILLCIGGERLRQKLRGR